MNHYLYDNGLYSGRQSKHPVCFRHGPRLCLHRHRTVRIHCHLSDGASCPTIRSFLLPGMGLNAYFTYTVVLGMGYTWQQALAAVFAEGIIFILLSLTNVREAIFNSIPMNLKHAVSVGIGLFIAFIGLQMPRSLLEMIPHW